MKVITDLLTNKWFWIGAIGLIIVIVVIPKLFKKKLTPSQYTEILFHELTHAWQFATGKLVIENYKVAKYGRKNYDLKEFEYFLQPWEVEAYGYQYCINRLFWDI